MRFLRHFIALSAYITTLTLDGQFGNGPKVETRHFSIDLPYFDFVSKQN